MLCLLLFPLLLIHLLQDYWIDSNMPTLFYVTNRMISEERNRWIRMNARMCPISNLCFFFSMLRELNVLAPCVSSIFGILNSL
jgi:hypothetical protein